MSVLKKILGVFKTILVVLMIIFIVCFCSIVYQKKVMKVGMPNLFGYTGGAIVSGSMEPNIHVGDYVLSMLMVDIIKAMLLCLREEMLI